jgi:hypothetical protein
VGYYPAAKVLVILYNTGRAYEYYGVPEPVYRALMKSESKGRYLNQSIRGQYRYRVFHGWQFV